MAAPVLYDDNILATIECLRENTSDVRKNCFRDYISADRSFALQVNTKWPHTLCELNIAKNPKITFDQFQTYYKNIEKSIARAPPPSITCEIVLKGAVTNDCYKIIFEALTNIIEMANSGSAQLIENRDDRDIFIYSIAHPVKLRLFICGYEGRINLMKVILARKAIKETFKPFTIPTFIKKRERVIISTTVCVHESYETFLKFVLLFIQPQNISVIYKLVEYKAALTHALELR